MGCENLTQARDDMVYAEERETSTIGETLWDPQVKLPDYLSEAEISRVMELLREECTAFAKDDDDVGFAPELKLDIEVTDNTPVKASFSSVQRPLFQEVKDYLHDLIAKGLIATSKSLYSSQMVCVGKRDSTLR